MRLALVLCMHRQANAVALRNTGGQNVWNIMFIFNYVCILTACIPCSTDKDATTRGDGGAHPRSSRIPARLSPLPTLRAVLHLLVLLLLLLLLLRVQVVLIQFLHPLYFLGGGAVVEFAEAVVDDFDVLAL